MVARAQGVGPKLAQRIINELKDKAGAIALGTGGAAAPVGGNAQDALSALANLGFRPSEAATAVARAEAEVGADATLDLLVRTALKKAAK
jgi:Holliday junction DNA helicase RuvA